MLPIKLTMSAFGPFADVQQVDFASLGDNPLFLINGPTGAGKTSILDAICFALYGKTTGDEREGSQMRCDMADEALLTYVEFSFKLAGKIYRIHRVPEQPRLKKSGDGYTQQKPEAQLYCIDASQSGNSAEDAEGDETLLVAAKVSQATTEIESLTGLDVDQFRQVMVLPQGKFRELLMADSKAREKILSQLFQTHIYRRIEDKLKQQALGISAQVRDHQSRRQGVLQSAELEEVEQLTEELAGLQPQLETLLEAKQAQEQRVIQSKQQLDLAQNLMGEFSQLSELEQEAASLKAQSESIQSQQAVLTKAEQADKVKPSFESWRSRSREHSAQLAQQHTATEKLAQADSALTLAKKQNESLSAKEAELSRLGINISELEGLAPKFAEREQARQTVTSASQVLAQLKQKGTQVKAKQSECQTQLDGIQQQLPELENKSGQQLALQQQKLILDARAEIFYKWQQVLVELQSTQSQLEEARLKGIASRSELDNAKTAQQTLQLSWHQGQAAILAQSLAQGEACPVCGSEEHPSPATSEAHLPTELELESAAKSLDEAQKRYSDAREAYKVLQQKLQQQQSLSQGFEAELGEYTGYSQAQIDAEKSQVAQMLAEANQAHQQLQILRQQETQFTEQLKEYQTQLEQEREAYTEQQGQVEKQKANLDLLDNTLPQAHSDLASLQGAIGQLQHQRAELANQINAIRIQGQAAAEAHASAKASLEMLSQAVAKAREQLALSETQFSDALNGAGFDSQDVFLEASVEPEQQQVLSKQIQAYQQACLSNQAKLEQLKSKLEDQTAPELAQLEASLINAKEQEGAAQQAWQGVHMRVEQLSQLQSQLAEMDKAAAKLEQEYSVIGTLSDVANGNTGNRVSLQRFVLSVLLDDVLLEASRRLQLMSKGRYRLLRKEDRAKGNKASGLELEVEDAYTSKVRSVATLSGGESFMAALSMALGLSDVVQAYAGGIKLDTLFIDEGFGSLDQDSLELAIRTLMDLQSSGRMIGVISHVSEMKEQIGTRLDVIKGAHGSETRVSLP